MNEIDLLLRRYPELSKLKSELENAVDLLCRAIKNSNKILVCGNGGSAADSLHIVGEMMKSFSMPRKLPKPLQQVLKEKYPQQSGYYIDNLQGTIPAISLVNEVSLMTAYSNDNCADLAFAQQVLGYGRSGDVLIAISTSGNSENVLHAARVAKVLGLSVLSLTGKSGGKLMELSDVVLAVPSSITYQIQELHLPLYHTICLAMEAELFDGDCAE